MDTATEAVLRGIIKALVQGGDADLAHRIRQNLYMTCEEMLTSGMPAEAADVGRLADFARDATRS